MRGVHPNDIPEYFDTSSDDSYYSEDASYDEYSPSRKILPKPVETATTSTQSDLSISPCLILHVDSEGKMTNTMVAEGALKSK